jgi:hypothetical protein
MNKIENSFEVEDMEKKEQMTDAVTYELNTRLVDMGEISLLDKREVEILDSIREKLGRSSSYEKLNEEIPEELLKEYTQVMFAVEQDKTLKRVDFGQNPESDASLVRRYEQAKALGAEIKVDPNVAYVLELPEQTI